MNSDKEIWVFLSHSNKDYEKVRQVRNILEEQDLRPLMFFLHCLNDDDEIDELIKREIDCRTRFILCDSEEARKSKWVQREVEYIKSKDRMYETIDLSKSLNEIKDDLQQFITKTRIFVSYNREEVALAKEFALRMSKYDFSVFMDMLWDYTQPYLQDYANETIKQLDSSAMDGFVIAFVNERVLNSPNNVPGSCRYELIRAIEKGKTQNISKPNTIVFTNNENVLKQLSADVKLAPLLNGEVHSLENIENSKMCDFVTEIVLHRLLPEDSILTMAENYRKYGNSVQDTKEVAWLYDIVKK